MVSIQPKQGSFEISMESLRLFLSTFFLFILEYSSFAQVSITPKIGISFSTFRNMNLELDNNLILNSNNLMSFTFGSDVEYKKKENALITNLSYIEKGGNFHHPLYCDLNYRQKEIDFSFIYKRYFVEHIAIYTGITIGVSMSSKIKGNEILNNENIAINENIKSKTNNTNYSIPLGVEINFYNLILNIQYSYGITDILKEQRYKNSKNSTILLTFGKKIIM